MAQFTNQAQLAYNNSVTNSNIAVGELTEVISATKTSVGDTYSMGDNMTYAVNIVNSGATAITGLTVTDNLGAYTVGSTTLQVTPLTYVTGSLKYYVNGVLQTTPTVSSDNPLTVTGISVPAGGNATLMYQATVNQYAPLAAESTIENQVSVSGGGITTIQANDTVTAVSEPDLTITKSICPVPVVENGTLTYTFTIMNYGNTAAAAGANAVITDTFDPILSDLSVTFNGTSWATPTNYTYDATTGKFATVAGQITVPAATYTQDATTGVWTVNPGVSTLVVSGTI